MLPYSPSASHLIPSNDSQLQVLLTNEDEVKVEFSKDNDESWLLKDEDKGVSKGNIVRAVAEMLRFGSRDLKIIAMALDLNKDVWGSVCSDDQMLDLIDQLCDVTVLSSSALNLAQHLAHSLAIKTTKTGKISAVVFHRAKYILHNISIYRGLPECSDHQDLWNNLKKHLEVLVLRKIDVPCSGMVYFDIESGNALISTWSQYIQDPSPNRFDALKKIAPFKRFFLLSPTLSEHKLLRKSSKTKKTLIKSGLSMNKSVPLNVRTDFLRFWASLLMGNPHPNPQLNKIHPDVQDLAAEHVAKCIDTITAKNAAEETLSDLNKLVDATSVALQASLQAIRVQTYRIKLEKNTSSSSLDKRADKKAVLPVSDKIDVCRIVALRIAETLLRRIVQSPMAIFSTPILGYNLEDIVSTLCFITQPPHILGVTAKLEDDSCNVLMGLCDESIFEASRLCPNQLINHIPRLFNVYDPLPTSNTFWFQTLSNLYPNYCNIELWENLSMFTDALLTCPSLSLLKLMQKMSLNVETVEHANRYLLSKREVLDKLEGLLIPTDEPMSLICLQILCNLAKNKSFSTDFMGRGGTYLSLINSSSPEHYHWVVNLLVTLALSKGGDAHKTAKNLISHAQAIKDVPMQENILRGLIELATVKPAAVLKQVNSIKYLGQVASLQGQVNELMRMKKNYYGYQNICRIV